MDDFVMTTTEILAAIDLISAWTELDNNAV
jgi:hypothetical protein